jgi:hypothetical protein
MAFIIKNKGKYFELVKNVRINWKHKRVLLFYMGIDLIIPKKIIQKYKITSHNINNIKKKYPTLIVA